MTAAAPPVALAGPADDDWGDFEDNSSTLQHAAAAAPLSAMAVSPKAAKGSSTSSPGDGKGEGGDRVDAGMLAPAAAESPADAEPAADAAAPAAAPTESGAEA